MDDHSLIRMAQAGDEGALSELYQRFSPEAYNVAYLLLGNRGLAEDVVQEAFIQVIRKVHTLKDPLRFRPWLFQIITNLTRKAHRKRQWHRWLSLDLTTHDKPDSTALPTGDHLEADEEVQELQAAIKRLKPAQQEPLILHYFNNLREDEIAEILQCPVGTVKSRLHAARQQLERILARPYVTQLRPREVRHLLAKRKGEQTHD